MANETKRRIPVINQKIVLSGLTLLMLMGIITISSFFPLIIDPTRWQTKEFLSDQLITISISIVSIISTMFIGQSSNAQNPYSELARARVKFFESINKITNVSAFTQWVKRVLQPSDIKSVERRYLREVGVKDFNIVNLEEVEIRELTKRPMKIGERYYSKITSKQKEVIMNIKHGKYKIKLVEASYYLTVSSINSDLTISEKSGKEEGKKMKILIFGIFWKIVFSIIFAMIFASFVRDLTQEETDIAISLTKFASRMFTLIVSASMGYRTGAQINDIDADYINVRVAVHNLFLQDTTFVPLTEEELAKEECDRIQEELLLARQGTTVSTPTPTLVQPEIEVLEERYE